MVEGNLGGPMGGVGAGQAARAPRRASQTGPSFVHCPQSVPVMLQAFSTCLLLVGKGWMGGDWLCDWSQSLHPGTSASQSISCEDNLRPSHKQPELRGWCKVGAHKELMGSRKLLLSRGLCPQPTPWLPSLPTQKVSPHQSQAGTGRPSPAGGQ